MVGVGMEPYPKTRRDKKENRKPFFSLFNAHHGSRQENGGFVLFA